MTKQKLIERKQKGKKYFLTKRGNKIVLLPAMETDLSDWIYMFDSKGIYKGCGNDITTPRNELKEISEEEFLKND